MTKPCQSCGACQLCSTTEFPHECFYPEEAARWHLCPKRTKESNSSAQSRARNEKKEDDLEF
jgi:hypothetical protein